MSTPSAPGDPDPGHESRVGLGKPTSADSPSGASSGSSPSGAAPFDPYRFGKPEHPVPPEFAPPGYVPDQPVPPYPPASNAPYGQPPYNQNPYGQPQHGQSPYGQHPYGQAPYGPGPYGYGPPPPYSNAYSQQQPAGNGKAVAGLVLGIASIVLFWLTIFDALFVVLALIFGILALNDSRNRNGAGRGMAIAGLVCCVIGALAAVLFSVYIFGAIGKCGGIDNQGSSDFQQCVQDHL